MSYKQGLGIENEYVFNEVVDNYFLNLGFYKSTMSPRFIEDDYRKLTLNEPCLRYDGDWCQNNEGIQRVFINKNEVYVERQTSYRSFDGSSYFEFEYQPSTNEEIEEQLDWMVRKY